MTHEVGIRPLLATPCSAKGLRSDISSFVASRLGRSQKSKSPSSRPLQTKPSSQSKTSGYSMSSVLGTANSPKLGAADRDERNPASDRQLPTDIQPVLERSRKTLLGFPNSDDAIIYRVEGENLIRAAKFGPMPWGRIGEVGQRLSRGDRGRAGCHRSSDRSCA